MIFFVQDKYQDTAQDYLLTCLMPNCVYTEWSGVVRLEVSVSYV